MAIELIEGFQEGFKLNFQGPRISIQAKNLRSVTTHEKALLEKINKEIDLGRIAGPFTEKSISNVLLNSVGVVPKSNGGWRLISHLSSPLGESVNDFIDPNLCSVSYSRFDDVIENPKIRKVHTTG